MLHLDATTKSIEVVLSGAVTTNQLPIVASYSDFTSSTGVVTLGESDTATNNTTVVTAVAAPSSGVTRNLDYLAIYNKDTVDATVTVQYNDNSTIRILFKETLATGKTLQYSRSEGFEGPTTSPFAVSQSGTWTVTGAGGSFPVTDSGGSLTVDDGGGSLTVDGTFWQATQPISAAALPLPTGAATAAKQPALGTAGSASVDVLSVQGVASMTALKVDGSAVAQPVTDNGGSLTVDGTFWQATQPVSLASVPSHAVTNAGTFAVQVDNTVTVGSHAVTNAGTFAVQATVAAAATSIAKAEDVASADADVGVPAMMVRKATPANTSGTDGDYEFLQGSAGRLWVDPSGVTLTVASHAVTNAGTFAVQAAQSGSWSVSISASQVMTDLGAFTAGADKVFMSGHVYDEVAGSAPTENDLAASRIDVKRAQIFVLEDETTRGRRATVTAANALKVDNSAVTQPANITQWATTALPTPVAPGDTVANPTVAPHQMALAHQWNPENSTWERTTGAFSQATDLTSTARTGSATSAAITNRNCTGVRVGVRVTTVPGSAPSVTLQLYDHDTISGQDYAYSAMSATPITAVGNYFYIVYPGITTTGHGASCVGGDNLPLPEQFKVFMNHGNANSITYSVSVELLP